MDHLPHPHTPGRPLRRGRSGPGRPRNHPKLSVVIPVKDEGDRLKRLLEALLAADYPREKLEVVVVDGGSDKAAEAITRELASGLTFIKVVREPNPRGSQPLSTPRSLT